MTLISTTRSFASRAPAGTFQQRAIWWRTISSSLAVSWLPNGALGCEDARAAAGRGFSGDASAVIAVCTGARFFSNASNCRGSYFFSSGFFSSGFGSTLANWRGGSGFSLGLGTSSFSTGFASGLGSGGLGGGGGGGLASGGAGSSAGCETAAAEGWTGAGFGGSG